MLRVGVIGYGYWGPNLVRNFVESGRAQVSCVSDLNSTRLALAKARYPGIETSTHALEVIGNPALDALVIATPVSSHFELAMAALNAGKHVLVEKPMTATSAQAVTLIEQANQRRLT